MFESERPTAVGRKLGTTREQPYHFGVVAGCLAKLRQFLERPLIAVVLRNEIAQGVFGELSITDGDVVIFVASVVMLGALAWLVLRWAREDTERQELLDLAYERGIDLDARRAGRAVASGRGAELRQRLVSRGEIENLDPS